MVDKIVFFLASDLVKKYSLDCKYNNVLMLINIRSSSSVALGRDEQNTSHCVGISNTLNLREKYKI